MRSFGRRRSSVRKNSATELPFRILGITPSSAAAGSGATPIDVAGIGFPPSAVVYLDGVAQTTNRVSQFLLQITVASGVVAVPGFKSLQVIDGIGQESNVWQWPVSFPVPGLSTLNPAFGYLGTGATAVSATGTGIYNPGTTSAADGSSAPFTYGSSTTGTVQVPAGILNVAGDHAVTLSNPAPGGGTSAGKLFQTRYKAPAITALSLTIIPINNGDTQVTITDSGGNFYNPAAWPIDGGTQGYVDGVAVATTYLSPTQVRIVVPAAVTAVPGTKVITVGNPTVGGGGGLSAGSNITVSAPSTSSLSWSTRPRCFSSFTIRITGTNLSATDVGRFRGTNLATTFVSSTALDVVMPANLMTVAGTFPVNVRTAQGYDTNGQNFTVLPWAVSDFGGILRQNLDPAYVTLDGSSRVQSWDDQSGGSRSPTQATASVRPSWYANVAGLNNEPAVFIDATRGDFLQGVTWVESGAAGLIQKTSFLVMGVVLALAAQQVTSSPTIMGCDNGAYISVCDLETPSTVRAVDDTGGTVSVDASFSWGPGTPFHYQQRKGGGNIAIRVSNGAEQSVVHGTPPSLFVPANQLIGRRTTGTGQASAYVGQHLVFDVDANWTVKWQGANHLAGRYGLTFWTLGTVATVASSTPNTATQFDVPFQITVIGTGFTSDCIVNCDGEPLATIVDSSTQLRAMLTTTSLATYGTKGITVSNSGGQSSPVALTIAQYIPGAGPNLTGISPTTKQQWKNQFTLTCNGSNFTPTSVVYWGATPLVTNWTGNTTQITATVPASLTYTAGNVNITVHDSLGNSGPQVISITSRTLANLTGYQDEWGANNVNTSGSNVTQFNDQGPNGRHLSQATGSKQGLLNATDSAINGQPSVSLDGVNDEYSAAATITSMITTSTWVLAWAYILEAVTGTGGPTTPYANNNMFGLSGTGFFGAAGKNTPSLWGYTNDGSYKVAANNALAVNTPQQAIYSKASGQLDMYINNVQGTPVTGVGLAGFSSQLLTLGSSLAGNYAKFRFVRAVICNVAWTADDFELWYHFCAGTYGIV